MLHFYTADHGKYIVINKHIYRIDYFKFQVAESISAPTHAVKVTKTLAAPVHAVMM